MTTPYRHHLHGRISASWPVILSKMIYVGFVKVEINSLVFATWHVVVIPANKNQCMLVYHPAKFDYSKG